MTDIKAGLIEAMRGQGILLRNPDGEDKWLRLTDEHLARIAERLLSTPRFAVVDLENIDALAKLVGRNWPDSYANAWPWDYLPDNAREYYRQQVRDVLTKEATP